MINLFKYIIVLCLFFNVSNGQEIKILFKINDNIITNQDIKKETNYLLSLNKNFENLDKVEAFNKAKNSLIREIIKKDEIDKFYEINYEDALNSKKLSSIIDNFRSNLGFNTNKEFENYLNEKNISFRDLKVKFIIEQFWNQLIFDKFSKQISINEKLIENKIKKIINSKNEIKSFNLSEIVFSEKTELENDKKYQEIINTINNTNFDNAAFVHSIADSSKLNGKLGWVNENQISNIILNELNKVKKNQITNKIATSGGFIILKINDVKITNLQIDEKEEKKRLILSEKNRILNEYSLIYFKEIENKAHVKNF